MNKMIKTLKPLVQGGYHTDIQYLVRAMQIILDAGKFPKNLCDLVAAQEETTRLAVRKGFSRITKIIWKNSAGILHEEGEKCPLPFDVLHDLAFLLSDGEIL